MAYVTKKMEREMRGPGLFEIVLGVAFSLILGVLLGAAHLVLKPVEKKSEKELAKDTTAASSLLYPSVYFTEGSTSSAAAAGWKTKQQAFTSGAPGDIVLSEEELNAFIAAAAPPPAAPKPAAPAAPVAKPAEGKAAPTLTVATLPPGVINFRVRDGVLQAAFSGNFSALGMPVSPIVQARGSFTKGADGYEFQASELYVGSLPLHKVPGLSGWLMNRLLAKQEGVPEDLKTAWKSLGNISVEGNTVRLSKQ